MDEYFKVILKFGWPKAKIKKNTTFNEFYLHLCSCMLNHSTLEIKEPPDIQNPT